MVTRRVTDHNKWSVDGTALFPHHLYSNPGGKSAPYVPESCLSVGSRGSSALSSKAGWRTGEANQQKPSRRCRESPVKLPWTRRGSVEWGTWGFPDTDGHLRREIQTRDIGLLGSQAHAAGSYLLHSLLTFFFQIESGFFLPYRVVFSAWWESKTPVVSRFHSWDFFLHQKKTGTPFSQ